MSGVCIETRASLRFSWTRVLVGMGLGAVLLGLDCEVRDPRSSAANPDTILCARGRGCGELCLLEEFTLRSRVLRGKTSDVFLRGSMRRWYAKTWSSARVLRRVSGHRAASLNMHSRCVSCADVLTIRRFSNLGTSYRTRAPIGRAGLVLLSA